MSKFTRREVLKVGAAGTATMILAGCAQESEKWEKLEPYVLAPEDQLAGVPTYYASACRMCPAGCGILVKIMNGRAIKIEGNPHHPVNRGKLCARGQSGLQLLYNPDRITSAVRHRERGSREFEPIHWEEAINELSPILDNAGDAVAVWTGSTTSGHLYDLFAHYTRAVGADDPIRYDLYTAINGYDALAVVSDSITGSFTLPSYDLGHADAIFSFGADFLGTWTSATGFGVEFGRFRDQPFGRRGFMVQFEAKMSITGAKADRWVPVKPGTEALVAQAIARLIADEGYGPAERQERAETLTPDVDIEAAAQACLLSVEELAALARAFAEAEHPVAIPGDVVTGRSNSLDGLMAAQALNMIAGTVGEPGSWMMTPNLPAEDFYPPPPSSFAQVQNLIERMNAGEIKALLIHGTNPDYDLPRGAGLREALQNVETIISFASIVNETALYADYILPDRVYLESWGYEVVSPGFQGLPVVSGQQPVVGPLYDIHSAGDTLIALARRVPAAANAFAWDTEVDFIKERIAALPKGANGGDDTDVQWARFQQFGGWWPETPPEAAQPVANLSKKINVPEAIFQGDEGEYPYFLHPFLSVLLSGDAGANIPWMQGSPDPLTTIAWQTWVEINPETARELGVEHGDIVKVESPYGELEAPVYVFPAIRPDTVAIPLGQGHTDLGRYAKSRGANPVHLLGAMTDEKSNSILAWANARVKITRTDKTKALAILDGLADNDAEAHIPF